MKCLVETEKGGDDSNVPVIRGWPNPVFNKLWGERKKDNKPFMAVIKAYKYAYIKYDMITCDFDLSLEAVKKLQDIFDTFEENNKGAFKDKSFLFTISHTLGHVPHIPGIELLKAKELAQKFAVIVMDKTNYACVIPEDMCKHIDMRPLCPEQTDCVFRAERRLNFQLPKS